MDAERSRLRPQFPSTQWTAIEQAAGDARQGRPVLSQLLNHYLPALRAHLVRRKGIASSCVDDLVQAFVERKILAQQLLLRADRSRGCKFRSFLLTALDHFVSNQLRGERRWMHSNGVSVEEVAAAADDSPVIEESSEFDIVWAKQVIYQTLQRMEEECSAKGRGDIWSVFAGRVLGPTLHGQPPLPYAKLVEQFGFRAPIQASMVLATAKRMFQRVLRQVVSEYAPEREQTEAEVRQLLKALEHNQ